MFCVMNKNGYNIMNLAEKTGMSIKLVKHYMEKYEIEDASCDLLAYNSFSEKHVKMLSIIKEINKSKYFTPPLASFFIGQAKSSGFDESLPGDGAEVLRRVNGLNREIREIGEAA